MTRPFWSGQIQISLVSFSIKMFPAVEAKSEIRFHQLSRKTGERVHHQNVSADDGTGVQVNKDDIVKGYEYRKGEFVTIEPAEIEALRIPSRHTLAVSQFVSLDDLDPGMFEKPYFVLPDGDNQTEAFTVIRKALQSTRKVAIGKIAFGGREHLIAISAPPSAKDDTVASRGMMAYTLRYATELRDPLEYFAQIRKTTVDADQLSLAKELIQRKSARFAPEKFHDDYESALKELVEAKVNHAPLPTEKPAVRSGKVINLMDALRKSVQSDAPASATRLPGKRGAKSTKTSKGLRLVKSTAHSTRSRKSA